MLKHRYGQSGFADEDHNFYPYKNHFKVPAQVDWAENTDS